MNLDQESPASTVEGKLIEGDRAKRCLVLMGQTPPPWHGQAVATQILFDYDWPDFDVRRVRMEFSEEMDEVGRFRWRKLGYLWRLIREVRAILKERPDSILLYPPASAKWVPFLRDVIFLGSVRRFAGSTVFIFHASGLASFSDAGPLRRILSKWAYHGADLSLEVAREKVSPHHVFGPNEFEWCPCAIEAPDLSERRVRKGRLEVLFVGSLQEGKGVLEVLRTAAWLRDRGRGDDIYIRIVGKWFSGEFEREAGNLHQGLGLDGIVEFTGQLTGEEKWEAYRLADVFFFPTHYASEASPIVLMEALGAGLPIVSTQWAGIPDMLDGCTTVSLQPVRSPSKYGDALESLLDKRGELPQISKAARAFYHEHFLPKRFVERVENGLLRVSARALAEVEVEGGNRLRPETNNLRLGVYFADQNPGYDRSFGISRMSQTVLEAMQVLGGVDIDITSSQSSQQPTFPVSRHRQLPWNTRHKLARLLTDNIHPVMDIGRSRDVDVFYYPKGYLPWLVAMRRPAVVTIHDAIIQHSADKYPNWRRESEYSYWKMILKHTIRVADHILTVSESAKEQIQAFIKRHRLPEKEITVTYEPCHYEFLPQLENPEKDDYVLHLASCEPHKRTLDLVKWWIMAEEEGRALPKLHLVGHVPSGAKPLLERARTIIERPFLEEEELRTAYRRARALILPSEIEGFGLPALEAYYLGTPVCFVKGTSVEEILGPQVRFGGFDLDAPESLFDALDAVLMMDPREVYRCGLSLRERFAAEKIARTMLETFRKVAGVGSVGSDLRN